MPAVTRDDLRAALQSSRIWWQDMGVEVQETAVPAKPEPAGTKIPEKPKPAQRVEKTGPVDRIARAGAIVKSTPTLEALKTALADFDAGLLSDNACNMVFARGNPEADIMVIGEAPGRHEDESGLPFVGPAGQLLDKMLAAIGLDESSSYISNVCNWRPPGNRNPNMEEMMLCKPFITRHIELAAPKLVLIVGGVSLEALCGITGIMRNHGQWQNLGIGDQNIPALPIYHPAFLLRRPELKKAAWHDLLLFKGKMQEMEDALR